ncbi:UNVERIFIED_CONTAM: signal transduction histidine kinase [Brevibacillus sp. OAP136]
MVLPNMRGIVSNFRIFLVLYRWFICLTICLFYITAIPDSTLLFLLLSLLFAVNIVVSILLFRPVSQKKQILLAVFDSLISAFLIVMTDGWSSPLVYQAYSSLLLFAFQMWGVPLLAYALLFFLTTMLVPTDPSNAIILDETMTKQLHIIMQGFTFVTLYLLGSYVVSYLLKQYRNALLLLRFLRSVPAVVQTADIAAHVEVLLIRILEVQHVFFYDSLEQEHSGEWLKALYRTKVVEQQRTNAFPLQKAGVVSPTCDHEDGYYYYPLLENGSLAGIIVIPLEEKRSLTRTDLFFLNVVSCVVKLHLRLISLKVETNEAAHSYLRKKLAQDMHDGLAQQLFFLSAQLFRMKQNMQPLHNDELASAMEEMEQQVKECHLEVRDVIANLRDEYEPCHIFDAVRKLLGRTTANSSLHLEYVTKGRVVKENVLVEEAIYRFVEESVYNVLKHARADELHVVLEATAVQWTVTVRDNGRGFAVQEQAHRKERFGLIGMKERVERVGGTVTIHSEASKGTLVVAVIPRWGYTTNG